MTRSTADLQLAVEVAAGYRLMARSIEADPRVRDLPVTARKLSRIARRAAISEEVDQDWRGRPVRACRVCGGEDVCIG